MPSCLPSCKAGTRFQRPLRPFSPLASSASPLPGRIHQRCGVATGSASSGRGIASRISRGAFLSTGFQSFRNKGAQKLCDERGEQVVTHVRDPDAAGDDDMDNPDQYPPNIFWRVIAACMYMIPWIDAVGLGREIYHKFPSFIYLYFMTGPFVGIYYSSQFAPLLIFFLMFLAIVKNNKLSHFVRFNCMQAIMLDIVVMLFTILHSYFPAELRWSWVLSVFDQYSWVASMGTVLYCVFFTLMGRYADLPYVSEAVYIQVEMSDYA